MAGSLVQSRFSDGGGGTTLSLAFSVANAAGNAIAAFGGDTNASGDTLTFTDTNNAYGAVDTLNDTTDGDTFASAKAQNIAAGANTVKLTSSGIAASIVIVEVGGVTSAPLDGHAAQKQSTPGTGADAISSGNGTNGATAFMVAVASTTSGVSTPAAGTGFTSSAGTNIVVTGWTSSFGGARLEWQASVAAGSHAGTFTDATNGGTDRYVTLMMMFDEGSGGGGGGSSPIIMGQACL